jgi:hypothetical protein
VDLELDDTTPPALDSVQFDDPALVKLKDLTFGMVKLDAPAWFRNVDFALCSKTAPPTMLYYTVLCFSL